MSDNASPTGPAIIPCLRYQDAPAAIDWLTRAFGLTKHMVVPGPDGTIAHAQMRFASGAGNGMIMLGSAGKDALGMKTAREVGGVTQSIYAVVDDADAHFAQAQAAGAEIVRTLQDTEYGSREYSARDPEGNLWSFGTYDPSKTPE